MPKVAPIHADSYQLGVFLSNHKCRIPSLQRPFAWSTVQAQELCDDLQPLIADSEGGQHFFGSIVLLMSAGEAAEVIDGQQRLTTTTLAIGILEHAALHVKDWIEAAGGPAAPGIVHQAGLIANSLHDRLWYSGPLDSNGRLVEHPRLQVSPEIEAVYLKCLRGEDVSPSTLPIGPARNLAEIALLLKREFLLEGGEEIPEPVARLERIRVVSEALLEKLLVVSLETSTPDAGYALFESLNSRGLDLNALDLIKVWVMSHFAGEGEKEVAVAMASLADGNRKEQMDFFRDYYRICALHHPDKKSDKRLALDARRHIFKDPSQFRDGEAPNKPVTTRISHHLAEMVRLTPSWKSLGKQKLPESVPDTEVDSNWIEFRMRLMSKELGHRGHIPMFLVACDQIREAEQVGELADFTHAVERFFFRYKVLCSGTVGNLEKAYFDIIKKFRSGRGLDVVWAKQRLQELLDEHADDEKFRARISEQLVYSSAAARKKIKYLLYVLDNYSFPNPPDKSIPDYAKFHIEHIAAQNGDHLDSPEDLHTIGNLTLLDPVINTSLSNFSFAEKKALAGRLRKDNKEIKVADSQDIFYGKRESWGSDDVYERHLRLLNRACEVFKLAE
jgi:hypothetical protein